MLEVKKLSVGFGKTRLLENLDVQVGSSQGVAMVGPSGCGKSTFLRTVAGLIDPLDGEILFKGRGPGEIGWPGYRRQVVYVEQKPALLDQTVMENLARAFEYRSAQGEFSADAAKQTMRRLGLDHDIAEQPARQLSVGQQQRVCLIRALLVEPRVLLLDEPTSALDGDNAGRVIELLQEFIERKGMGLLLVTHQRQWAENLCGEVIDLRESIVGRDGVDG